MIRILCYGDSNTWGYIPGSDHERFGNNERWTKLLASFLGDNYEIIEEGLNSRTLLSNDTRPGREGRIGYDYLIPCLDSHDPIDLVILMLGTNELKNTFHRSVEEIGKMYEEYFVKTILSRVSKISSKAPQLLIVAPPPINEDTPNCTDNNKYVGASMKVKELGKIYEQIANRYHCTFLSANELETGIDGVHLTKESHQKLAEMLEEKIKEIFE